MQELRGAAAALAALAGPRHAVTALLSCHSARLAGVTQVLVRYHASGGCGRIILGARASFLTCFGWLSWAKKGCRNHRSRAPASGARPTRFAVVVSHHHSTTPQHLGSICVCCMQLEAQRRRTGQLALRLPCASAPCWALLQQRMMWLPCVGRAHRPRPLHR